MKSFRSMVVLFILIIFVNVLFGSIIKNEYHKLSWGIFIVLCLLLVVVLVMITTSSFVLLIKFIFKHNTYRLGNNIIKELIVLAFIPMMILTQIVFSSIYVFSPDNGYYASVEQVNINDSEQYISVRTKDESLPVILFLAGGPGGTQMQATREFLSGLEENFTVINWDQPGTGKSYDAKYRYDVLTQERYVEDGHALTEYLMERFNQEKIYLIGESWGSYLAVLLCDKYPENYYAMIGTGQMVAFLETEEFCYNYVLDKAIDNNDAKLVDTLNEIGLPPYYGDNISLKMNTYLQRIYIEMATSSNIQHQDWDTFDTLISPEYSIWDSIGFIRGLLFTFSDTYQTLYDKDLRTDVAELSVPIFIFHGEHDVNAPLYLAEEYYNLVNAPEKDFVLFERSGHNPMIDEYELFCEEVISHFNFHLE
jgi:pimeloyl-ACP methyl ester carboxylesterase